jgi:hypothetical protein
MTVVVDANILIAFGLSDEPLHTQANQVLSSWATAGTPLAAPRLFRSEITAVEFHEDDALLKSAYELAEEYNRPRAYDSQYLALTQRLSCEFWTADERLFNAAKDQFPGIRWLGNLTP